MRKEYLDSATNYKGQLKPFMAYLEEMGCWKCIEEKTIEEYVFSKYEGTLFVCQVKVEGLPNLKIRDSRKDGFSPKHKISLKLNACCKRHSDIERFS